MMADTRKTIFISFWFYWWLLEKATKVLHDQHSIETVRFARCVWSGDYKWRDPSVGPQSAPRRAQEMYYNVLCDVLWHILSLDVVSKQKILLMTMSRSMSGGYGVWRVMDGCKNHRWRASSPEWSHTVFQASFHAGPQYFMFYDLSVSVVINTCLNQK